MVTVQLKINDKNVWLIFENLVFYKQKKLIESNNFLCYFCFSLPINLPYGELILDDNHIPKIFMYKTEAEEYALNYLKSKLEV